MFDPASARYFAALAAAPPSAPGGALLSWPHSATGGTIKQAATHVALPSPAAAVLPVAGAAARSRRAAAGSGAAAMEIDEAEQPAVYVAHTNGSVSLCSTSAVLSESGEPAGLTLLAAAVEGGVLRTLHLAPASAGGAATLGSFSVAGSRLRCEALLQLAAPSGGASVLAGTHTEGRAALLWSDGSLAIYDASDDGSGSSGGGAMVEPAVVRRLQGFRLPPPPPPKNGKTPARGGKKRAHADADGGATAASGGAAVVAVGGGLVAVVGWAAGGADGGAALRVVAVDVQYGCVHVAVDLAASSVGMSDADPGERIQVRRRLRRGGWGGGGACAVVRSGAARGGWFCLGRRRRRAQHGA